MRWRGWCRGGCTFCAVEGSIYHPPVHNSGLEYDGCSPCPLCVRKQNTRRRGENSGRHEQTRNSCFLSTTHKSEGCPRLACSKLADMMFLCWRFYVHHLSLRGIRTNCCGFPCKLAKGNYPDYVRDICGYTMNLFFLLRSVRALLG